MLTYAFDIEIFQNFFSVIFDNVEDEFDCHTFVIFGDRDNREELRQFVNREITLVGYNSIQFDNTILNAVCEGMSIQDAFELAQKLIKDDYDDEVRRFRWKKVSYKTVDIISILALDSRFSLKQLAINLKWPKIQELLLNWNKEVKEEEIPLILNYNANDVGITKKLYWAVKDEIDMRVEVSETFGLDLTNASRSQIGNLVLEKNYSEKTGLDPKYFRELRTPRNKIPLLDCIGNNISFESKELTAILNNLKSSVIDSNSDFVMTINYARKIFDLKKGGLHSRDIPGVFSEDEDYIVIDVDVSSFYPFVMIRNKIKPKHIRKEFLDILEKMTNERIDAKKNNFTTKAEVLKIAINAVFGKLGYPNFWLYDRLAFYSVTISGQLYLLMLIEALFLAGCEILSANTDGIVCRVPRNKEDNYYKACNDWMNKTKFKLDYTRYLKYIRRDGNNYFTQKSNSKPKKKGVFYTDFDPYRGYNHPIIYDGVLEYFINGIQPEDFLASSNDIHDYFMSQKAARKYQMQFRQNGTIENIQHTNRFYVSTDGGDLVKIDPNGKEISLCANGKVRVLNEIPDNYNIEDLKLDKSWYLKEINKLIFQIQPPVANLSLF